MTSRALLTCGADVWLPFCVCRLRRVVQARFADPMVDEALRLAALLKEAAASIITLHSAAPASLVAASSRMTALTVGMLVVVLALLTVVYFPVVIGLLNRSVKGGRGLLTLLPPEIVLGTPALRETVASLTKRLL